MSIRNQLLQEIHSAKGCTLADLMDGTGFDRKRLHDNLKAAIDDGLLQRTKDEITGQPFYTLTELDAERLAAGPAKNIKRPTQAGSGAFNNPGSSASVPSSEVSHPAGGAAVETLPGGLGTPDPAADEIQPPQYDPDSVSFNPDRREIAEFKEVIERLMQERIYLLEALDAATTARDEALARVASLESNAELPLMSPPLVPAPKFAVVGIADLFDCPQTAAEASHDDGYEAGIVIQAWPIGTVQVKAMFVPDEVAA